MTPVASKTRIRRPAFPLYVPDPLAHLAVAYTKKSDLVKAKATTAELFRIAPNFRLSNGAIYPSLRGKALPLPAAALFRSGETDDVSTMLRASDGVS